MIFVLVIALSADSLFSSRSTLRLLLLVLAFFSGETDRLRESLRDDDRLRDRETLIWTIQYGK